MNSKYQRLLERIPQELSTVLGKISANWELLSYNPDGPGWAADILVKGRKFRLSSEYMYIGVEEILDGSFRSVMPPEDQRIKITPQQVATLIIEEIG